MRDRQTDRQRFEDMERNIRRVRDTDRMTYRQADRQTERQKVRQTYWQAQGHKRHECLMRLISDTE